MTLNNSPNNDYGRKWLVMTAVASGTLLTTIDGIGTITAARVNSSAAWVYRLSLKAASASS